MHGPQASVPFEQLKQKPRRQPAAAVADNTTAEKAARRQEIEARTQRNKEAAEKHRRDALRAAVVSDKSIMRHHEKVRAKQLVKRQIQKNPVPRACAKAVHATQRLETEIAQRLATDRRFQKAQETLRKSIFETSCA